MADNELPGKVKAWVDARIGGNAITRKPGHPHAKDDKCFVLVDDALQGAGAKTARDFAPDGRIGPNDNYVWGDPVELDKIQPGDVLQFRNHKVVVRADVQNENGMWREQSTSGPYVRPHHCAIVVEVKAVTRLTDVHRAQLISYLRTTGLRGGLLLNFHVPVLPQGMQRIVL